MVARMRKAYVISIMRCVMAMLCCLLIVGLTGCKENFVGMLNPKGIIAFQERKLFFDTMALMLIVVLPVIIMSLAFVYHYQISHRITDYQPNWSHSFFLETIWWGVPCAIIVILAVITWRKTHELDPYRPIPGQTDTPMLIEAIALPWKWLFIYPEQRIATVNYLEIPVGAQIHFYITADNVPMSAFFIPQLGSQIYAMAGMRTRLHLLANEIGTYQGLNTQYNGDGFSDMHFTVNVVSPEDMQKWIKEVKASPNQLTEQAYTSLLVPTIKDQPKYFTNVSNHLFMQAMDVYMHTYGTIHPRANIAKFIEG